MSDEDPIRWADADPPPELLALVRDASRPPPLPPALRASMRASVLRAARPLPLRPPFVAGLTVVVVVAIGLVIWRVLPIDHDDARPPPERAVEIERPDPRAPRADPVVLDEDGTRAVVRRLDATRAIEAAPAPAPPPREHPDPATATAPPSRALPRETPRPSRALEGRPRDPARDDSSGGATIPAPRPFVRRTTSCNPFTDACEEHEPAPAAPAGWGTVIVQTIPWAHVYIDGRDTGRTTPVRGLRVPAGRHVLGLRDPDGVMHTVPIVVDAGASLRIVRQL